VTCYRCGAEITTNERAGRIFAGTWLCELCLEKAERCAPREDYEGGNHAIYKDDEP